MEEMFHLSQDVMWERRHTVLGANVNDFILLNTEWHRQQLFVTDEGKPPRSLEITDTKEVKRF